MQLPERSTRTIASPAAAGGGASSRTDIACVSSHTARIGGYSTRMSWARRIALLLAVVIPVAVVGTLMQHARARELAAQEALMEATKRRLAELAPIQKQIEDFQEKKKEYEARIQAIERLRAVPSPKVLMEIASTAESLGLGIEEMTVSGMALRVVFRAPDEAKAVRFQDEIAKRGWVAGGEIKPGAKGHFVLSGTLVPARPEE